MIIYFFESLSTQFTGQCGPYFMALDGHLPISTNRFESFPPARLHGSIASCGSIPIHLDHDCQFPIGTNWFESFPPARLHCDIASCGSTPIHHARPYGLTSTRRTHARQFQFRPRTRRGHLPRRAKHQARVGLLLHTLHPPLLHLLRRHSRRPHQLGMVSRGPRH